VIYECFRVENEYIKIFRVLFSCFKIKTSWEIGFYNSKTQTSIFLDCYAQW
jgi:hypothetical protein